MVSKDLLYWDHWSVLKAGKAIPSKFQDEQQKIEKHADLKTRTSLFHVPDGLHAQQSMQAAPMTYCELPAQEPPSGRWEQSTEEPGPSASGAALAVYFIMPILWGTVPPRSCLAAAMK